MFCTKCGTQNAVESGFCSSCGKSFEGSTPVAPAPQALSQEWKPPADPFNNPIPAPVYAGTTTSRAKTIVPVVAGLALFGLIIAFVLIFVIGDGIGGGGGLEGTWETAALRHYIDGRLDMAETIPAPMRDETMEFLANGDLYVVEGGQREFVGRWQSLGDGRFRLSDFGWVQEGTYSISGRELTLRLVEDWGIRSETVIILQRVR